jgi:membrane-associated protease RseP (regulator of RpoE activity)
MQMSFLKNWINTNRETLRIIGQVLLFLATFVSTTIAGAEWSFGRSVYMEGFGWQDFVSGLPFSISFLSILTVHEFGHYFTARFHGVRSSLPYYIPLPPFPLSIGTMGAVIRLRQRVYSNIQNFDIGLAGPLAGFILALGILFYGFTNLPDKEYIFQIHPEYEVYGDNYADYVYTNNENVIDIVVGKNLLFMFFEKFVADPERMPNPHELMHYPFLFAGFLALVFTSLNLLPIGQLDGGHILYGLVGYKRHKQIATIVFLILLSYSGLGLLKPSDPVDDLLINIPLYLGFLFFAMKGLRLSTRDTLMYASILLAMQFSASWFFPTVEGYSGWMLFAFVIGRFLGIDHPPCLIEVPLDNNRKILGWIALLIFILSFTPAPL